MQKPTDRVYLLYINDHLDSLWSSEKDAWDESKRFAEDHVKQQNTHRVYSQFNTRVNSRVVQTKNRKVNTSNHGNA